MDRDIHEAERLITCKVVGLMICNNLILEEIGPGLHINEPESKQEIKSYDVKLSPFKT